MENAAIEAVVGKIEENASAYGYEVPGWNELVGLTADAIEAYTEENGSFDVDNDDDFANVVEIVENSL